MRRIFPKTLLSTLAVLTAAWCGPADAAVVTISDFQSETPAFSRAVGADANLAVADRTQDYTWSFGIDLEPFTGTNDAQVLLDFGGGVNGLSLVYRPGNILTVASSQSGALPIQFDTALTAAELASPLDVVLSYDFDPTGDETINLFLNQSLRGTAMGEDPNIHGANTGRYITYTDVASNVAGGYVSPTALTDFVAGSATDLNYFPDTFVIENATAVPEPSSLVVLGIGAIAGLRRRRRR